MAKRKRLSAPNPMFFESDSAASSAALVRGPIADVAADSAASAALEEVAAELTLAREGGRMVVQIPLETIDQSYLVRDRLVADNEEMDALVASIRERGQQTPIEVTRLAENRYGLISGWRRCQALARLQANGQGDGTVLALERRPENASDAYRAMIEENEIRVGLSYFERARIVDVAVEQGVFETHNKALRSLFSTASRAKRSKIGSFVSVVQTLGDALAFPTALGERLGLRLSRLIEQHPARAQELAVACTQAKHKTADEEQSFLSRWVANLDTNEQASREATPDQERLTKQSLVTAPIVTRLGADLVATFHTKNNRLELSGKGLTEDLRVALLDWLAQDNR